MAITDDPLAGAPPLEPPPETQDAIPRDEPDIDTKRERLVTAWADRVKNAKAYWEPSFKRMKDDQEFVIGKQWSKDKADPRYVANLTLRLVAQKTAFLYAKNPKAVAKRRERINAVSWDETQSTLTQLMQSGAMMVQQGQQMAAMGAIPPDTMAAAGGPMLQAAQGVMGSMMPMAQGASGGGMGADPNAIAGALGGAAGGPMPGMGGDPMSSAIGGMAAGGIPGVNPLVSQAVGSGVNIMLDAARVKNENVMMDKLARTLQLLYAYEIDQQPAPFKAMLKMTVRRTCTTGVGYVKLGFERVMQERPDLQKGIADASERLATLERLAADAADDITDENDAEAEQLQLLINDMMSEQNIVVREGLTFDYPLSYNIIPDTKCIELKHWTAAEWVAEEFLLSPSDIEEIYGVDVRGHCNEYSIAGDDNADPIAMGQQFNSDSRNWDDRKDEKKAVVWEIYCRKDGMIYVLCDGYKDFLREPASPDIYNERFFPWYALVFNECDHERELFPPSDVRLMRDMQLEYNRCREGLKEQRIAARPFIATVSGAIDDADMQKITERKANDIVELNALQPNQDVKQLLQAYAGAGIDPNLYEVNPVYEDILRTTGIQEANLGGTSNATATQANIAEGSRMTSMGSNIDDLNDLLTELARNGGQILLREMSPEKVKEVVGEGAVWPQISAQQVAQEVLLEIEAGSMGRPNAAQEVANAQRLYPLLIQLPGIDPEFLAKDLLRRLDDRLDLTQAFKSSLPSIVAMNGAAQGSAAGAGMGPGAGQGPQGRTNAMSPGGPAPGGPPDQTGQLTGTPPPRPHPGGAPMMPGMAR
jgi:hypothetical protein